MEFNESLELTASLKRIASPQQCSLLLQCQHYAICNVKKKLCLSLLHWGKRWVQGKYRQIYNSLFRLDRLSLPLFGRTPGICSVPQNPNVRRGHVFVSMPQPCGCFPTILCITFLLTFLQCSDEAASDLKPPLPVCPSVPETLNLWGQSRSQVRSSGTGLHSVSTRQKEKVILLSEFHSWWSSSDRCFSRHCHLYYPRKTVRRDNVTLTSTVCPWRDRDTSGWTRRSLPLLLQHTLSGDPSYWLALCYRPHWGPIGRQPRVATPPWISASAESWVHCFGVSSDLHFSGSFVNKDVCVGWAF